MDEAAAPALHRWRSFCRLLMQFHPRVGAWMYETHLGGQRDLAPGWNAVHSPPGAAVPLRYIWIGAEEGRNTATKPDVPEAEIHHVHETDIPAFEDGLAWRQLQRLAPTLTGAGLPGYRAAEITSYLARLAAAANAPLRGPTPSVDARIGEELGRIKHGIVSGAGPDALLAPLRDVIDDALGAKLSVTHASNVLAVLLAHLLGLPSPLDRTPFPARVLACVDHLIERVVALREGRQAMKLTPYFDATVLALLYGNTALLLCRQGEQMLSECDKTRRLLERRGLYVDEVMAHDLAPCLMHPVDWAPCSPAEYQHAARFGIVDAGGIYRGAGVQGNGPVEVEAVWDRIVAYSAAAADCDIRATIRAENTPLPAAAGERLATFLVTMQLGRGLGPPEATRPPPV